MQKALWLTALAFVATAVAAVALAEYGYQHPHTVMGRAVSTLKGETVAPAPTAGMPTRVMAGSMINLGDVDDRAALRDLKVLAYLEPKTEPGKPRMRTEDYVEDFDMPVTPAKPAPVAAPPVVEDDETPVFPPCPCMASERFTHRMAQMQLQLCDCQHAIAQTCAMMAAQQADMNASGRIIYRNVFVQECCPPPCGFWKMADADCPPDCQGGKPCCQPAPITVVPCCPPMMPVMRPAPCAPCMPPSMVVVERAPEPRTTTNTVQLKIVSGGQTQEIRITGTQLQVEIRVDGKAETKETAAKKCCGDCGTEGCCGKSCCTDGCCGKCKEAVKKEETGCKCCPTPCSEKKPATCPGCCGEKKKTTGTEPEAKLDTDLKQASFSGAAAAKRPMRMMTKIFPVGDLLDATGQDDDQLVDGCRMKVAPSTWQTYGGIGQIAYFPPGRCLVVQQMEDVMEELEDYIDRLRTKHLPPVPPDVPEEGTYLLPFMRMQEVMLQQIVPTQPVRLELPPSPPMILELVPVPPVDPAVPGFIAPVPTPERLPMCEWSANIASAVIQAQFIQPENNSWLLELLVPYYSLGQNAEKK